MKARENPFATYRIDRLAFRFSGGDWKELLAALQSMSYRCAIVGPHGSGKTTLLDEIAARLTPPIRRLTLTLENKPFPESAFFEGLGSGDILLFDGADLLSDSQWKLFLRKSAGVAGLIITSHRAGLLPTLIECRTSLALLTDLVGELTGSAALPLQNLYEKHRGNLRDVMRELYDIYTQM